MQLIGIVEKKVYCRLERENSQKYLERSRLNWAMRGEREGGESEKDRGSRNQRVRNPLGDQ